MRRDPSLLWVSATANSKELLQPLREAIAGRLENSLLPFIDEPAVKAAQQRIALAAVQAAAQPDAASQQLVDAAARGDWRLAFAMRDGCAAVMLDDIRRVVRTYLSRFNRSSGFVYPRVEAVGVDVPDAPPLATQSAELTAAAAAAPPPDHGDPIDFDAVSLDFNTQRLQPHPGLRLAVLRKRLAGGQARLRLSLRFGTPEQGAGIGKAWPLMARVLVAGTASRSQLGLETELNALQVGCYIEAQPQGLDVSLSGPAERMPAAIEIVGDLLRHPRMDVDDFERAKQIMLSAIDGARDQPDTRIRTLTAQLLNSAHRLGPDDAGYQLEGPVFEGRVRALGIDDLRRYQQELMGAADVRVAALGDLDASRLGAAVDQALAGWQPGAQYEPQVLAHVDVPGQRLDTSIAGQANALLHATMYLSMKLDAQDYWPLVLASRALADGPDSRLWHRLRDRLGASYDVRGSVSISPRSDDAGFHIQATFAPSRLEDVLRAIGEEIEAARRDGFDSREIDRARRGFAPACPDIAGNEDWLLCMLDRQLDLGQTFSDWNAAMRSVASVSNWQASRALRKYIDWRRFVIVSAGDFPSGDTTAP